MAHTLTVIFALLAVASAGYIAPPAYSHSTYSYGDPYAVATPAIISQHSNILRSHGNLGHVSTYAKSISTPHSSVYKSDTRISNGAFAYPYSHGYAAAAPYSQAYAAPAYTHSYTAPSYVAPVYRHEYATPAYAQGYAAHSPTGLLGVAYSPATTSAHFSYSNGYGLHYSY